MFFKCNRSFWSQLIKCNRFLKQTPGNAGWIKINKSILQYKDISTFYIREGFNNKWIWRRLENGGTRSLIYKGTWPLAWWSCWVLWSRSGSQIFKGQIWRNKSRKFNLWFNEEWIANWFSTCQWRLS